MNQTSLLDKSLVIVMGKGGVGKSTIAAALGLRAARNGRRTIIAEIGSRGDIGRMFADPSAAPGPPVAAAPGERELASGLFTIAIDPRRALEEYLADQLPGPGLARLLGASRSFAHLTAATPGLSELLCIGKVWELAQPNRRAPGARPYDLVILDAPATGHGIALLAAPRTFARAANAGPIARQGDRIHASLADPRNTCILTVATPHEPAVNEALESRERLRAELEIEPGRLIVNAVHPRRFTPRDAAALRAAVLGGPAEAEQRALDLALTEEHRSRSERAQIGRLRRALANRPSELPFVYAAALGPTELGLLAGRLEPAL